MPRTLYVYDHCPFCVKARMIFGLKNISVDIRFVLNNDEETPTHMVGRKLLPILAENGEYVGESLDIVRRIDARNPILTGPVRPEIKDWISGIGDACIALFLPRAGSAPLPEFATTAARAYFIRKKEEASGAFSELLARTPDLVKEVNAALEALDPLIQSPSAVNGTRSTDDLHLFATLHSLSLVKGLVYPRKVAAYRQELSHRSKVPLLDALAA